jgi:DNA-binding MarR family transcriptional regulator
MKFYSRGMPAAKRSAGAKKAALAKQIDEQQKELLTAIAEFSALLRRPEPPRRSKLALGRTLQRHGLEQRHATALLTVALYGPMTVTELSQRHHVSLKTASLIAVQLHQAGLIERRDDPADRRRTILSVAKAKERAVYEGLSRRAAHLERALDRLTPSERKGLLTGLRVLAEEMAGERAAE